MTALTADTAHALCKKNPPQKLLHLRRHGHTSPFGRNHSDRLTPSRSPLRTHAGAQPTPDPCNIIHSGLPRGQVHSQTQPPPSWSCPRSPKPSLHVHDSSRRPRDLAWPTSPGPSLSPYLCAALRCDRRRPHGLPSKPTSAKVSLLSRATPMSPMETRLPRGVAATVPSHTNTSLLAILLHPLARLRTSSSTRRSKTQLCTMIPSFLQHLSIKQDPTTGTVTPCVSQTLPRSTTDAHVSNQLSCSLAMNARGIPRDTLYGVHMISLRSDTASIDDA